MAQKDIYKLLFDALCTNNIQLIMNEIYKIIKHPISYVDVEYNVIGLIPNQKMNDPLWDSMYETRIVTYDMVYELNRGNYQKGLDEHKDILFIDYGIGEVIPRIAVTCKNNNQILGYFCILYPNNDYQDADYDVIKSLSDALALGLLNTKEHFFSHIKGTETFIKVLFEEKITTKESLTHWINQTKINIQSSYAILCSKVESGSNNIVYLKQLRNIINNRNDRYYATLIDEHLFILCTNIKTINIKEYANTISDLLLLINSLGFSVGISDIFENILDLTTYKYQASRLLELNQKDSRNNYYYQDFILHDIFAYANKEMEKHNYKNQILHALLHYDVQNKTEYYHTLKTYICNLRDSNETIKELNIHRNTLLYRLQKIEEITSYNLKDKKICTKLLCDFYMNNN
jgi:hypothetical protein